MAKLSTHLEAAAAAELMAVALAGWSWKAKEARDVVSGSTEASPTCRWKWSNRHHSMLPSSARVPGEGNQTRREILGAGELGQPS